MGDFEIYFPGINYKFPMVFVKGSGNTTWLFGAGEKVPVGTKDFYISKYTVTQRLWECIMGNNPAGSKKPDRPVEHVSFDDITFSNGFLDKLNSSNGSSYTLDRNIVFRLPSETEWEYAARGGTHWTEDFQFSGSNNMHEVGWFDENAGKYTDREILSRLSNQDKGTGTHDVGQKLPNQLGIFDMSGNVWEWCEDYYQPDIHKIPTDGTPYLTETDSRVLRGGCHHNWSIHCTVSKRYQIEPRFKDGCIGLRIAASL